MSDETRRPELLEPDRRHVDPITAVGGEPVRGNVPAPGGPYFGRLLIVLFAAVAFCALMTWYLSTSVSH